MQHSGSDSNRSQLEEAFNEGRALHCGSEQAETARHATRGGGNRGGRNQESCD